MEYLIFMILAQKQIFIVLFNNIFHYVFCVNVLTDITVRLMY